MALKSTRNTPGGRGSVGPSASPRIAGIVLRKRNWRPILGTHPAFLASYAPTAPPYRPPGLLVPCHQPSPPPQNPDYHSTSLTKTNTLQTRLAARPRGDDRHRAYRICSTGEGTPRAGGHVCRIAFHKSSITAVQKLSRSAVDGCPLTMPP